MEKENAPEFTAKDEEVLVLFASLAATAIANARTYRDERRTRADLEALVETSPVGVVVMDAAAGRAVSFNREARRIMEPLRTAGRPLEELQGSDGWPTAPGRCSTRRSTSSSCRLDRRSHGEVGDGGMTEAQGPKGLGLAGATAEARR